MVFFRAGIHHAKRPSDEGDWANVASNSCYRLLVETVDKNNVHILTVNAP